jgi:hypothetical protein
MPKARYPANHQPILRVPRGGSMCLNCRFLGDDERTCTNRYYIEFHGTDRLPYPADQMCSDWWQARTSGNAVERALGKKT